MSEELDVLGDIARRLAAAGIPYMVTGSMAANFYAVPRMTRDIDVVIELSVRDVDRLVRLFESDFYVDRDMIQTAVRGQGMFNLIHTRLLVKVDFVVRKDSPYRIEEFSRRRRVSLKGDEVFLVAPEDLILSKLDWAKDTRSEVQLADVRGLLANVEGLDREYLARWANRLGIDELYREVSG
jgi:hypothetical protein